MGMPKLSAPAATPLRMRVEGMDCSACALKIENALKRLRGISEVNVNYGIETLTFQLDQDRISVSEVEAKIRALGYTPWLLDNEAGPASGARGAENGDIDAARFWWRTQKGQRVIGTGSILLGAFVVSLLDHAISYWAYVGAAAIGLAPVAQRAIVAAVAGTPFSI